MLGESLEEMSFWHACTRYTSYGGSLHSDCMCSLAELDWWVWKDCFSLPSCPHKRLKMKNLFPVNLNSEFKWCLWIICRTCKKGLVRTFPSFPLQIFQQRFVLVELTCGCHSPICAYDKPVLITGRIITTLCLHTADSLLVLPLNIPPSWSTPSVLLSLAELMYLGYSEANLKWI